MIIFFENDYGYMSKTTLNGTYMKNTYSNHDNI